MTLMLKHREQILVVEDDSDSRQIIGQVLQGAGYDVELARDAFEALECASLRRPDLVLTDLQMPGLDGLGFTRRLHTFAPTVPVVLTTGVDNTKNVVTAGAAYGVVACLRKPMKLDELLWSIDSALVVARQRQAPVVRGARPSTHAFGS